MASYPGADHATVSEVVLVPGPGSLLAPQWVPWDQRVRPGDLSPGDLLAPLADDLRLVPGYMSSGDPQVDETAAEIGLGRRTVMSAWGRAEAAQRWHDGDHGPRAQMAQSTKRVCRDCGFLLPLAGSLGAMFGVCGNEMSADGSHRRLRIRLRRAFRHSRARGQRFADVRPLRRRRARRQRGTRSRGPAVEEHRRKPTRYRGAE